MDLQVRTGHTQSGSGTTLVALDFPSAHGEHAMLLLQITAPPRDAKTLEEECTSIVEHALLGAEGDAWQRLDGTLKEMNGLFKGLLVSDSIKEVHAIVSIVDRNGTVHVSPAGRAEAYLIRGGATSQITDFMKGKPAPAFVNISSGQLEPRDAVVLSTQRLLRTVTPAQLSQLAQRGDQLLDEVVIKLEAEREMSALATVAVPSRMQRVNEVKAAPARTAALPSRRNGRQRNLSSAGAYLAPLKGFLERISAQGKARIPQFKSAQSVVQEKAAAFFRDLKHPERKRRAHLLLLAGALAAFLVVWMTVRLMTSSQRSKTRTELEELVGQINAELRTAENRHLTGDVDSANAILVRAEERAKQVMDNESGLFRIEALDLLDRIRAKREEINNIVRLSPRVVVNIGAKNPDVTAQGIIGLADGEFIAYDRQNLYRVLLNTVEDPDPLTEEDVIIDGVSFTRYKTLAFLTSGNSVLELIADQPTTMKTEDPAGWITGKDMETYLRFLYILSPENNQIYKYERLSNRYGAPVQYNVNGDLAGSVDMVIDTSVYVLKEGGTIVKLLRGEVQPFSIRHAPEEVLKDVARMYKVSDGNFYFLDPVRARVIVATDGGTTGESSYVRQYVLEGDQIGKLTDLFVDLDQTHLYVLDEKRLHVIDLAAK
ncbi:MAG: hypothetical protein Q7R81_06680 [Candidatus Peregrinibacteria bacterium]|nr:hypothetical protein [Candidatus Peregrinibacteria bacterium]